MLYSRTGHRWQYGARMLHVGYQRLQTHNQNMQYLLPSHGNNSYANAPHCYVYTCIGCLRSCYGQIRDIRSRIWNFFFFGFWSKLPRRSLLAHRTSLCLILIKNPNPYLWFVLAEDCRFNSIEETMHVHCQNWHVTSENTTDELTLHFGVISSDI